MIKKYTKKPIEIEAVRLTLANISDVAKWCGGTLRSTPPMKAITGLSIKTLEGVMAAEFGDYIIKGVKGEFYPCKPDIFEASYDISEPVWAKKSEMCSGLSVTVWGIPCVGEDGSAHFVHYDVHDGYYITCSHGKHFLEGQTEGDLLVGIKLVK